MSGQFCSILIKGTVKSSYIALIAYCSHRIHDVGAVRKEAKKIEFVFFFFLYSVGDNLLKGLIIGPTQKYLQFV